jgi:hypothetical protein
VVQTAGNTLEDRVQMMGETAVLVRLEQEDKNVVMKDPWKALDGDITKLQGDIVDQNDVNNT